MSDPNERDASASVAGERGSAAVEFRFVDVDGIRVCFVRQGACAGVPVLFLHDFASSLMHWLPSLTAVGTAAPAIALDLPGHGFSALRLPATDVAGLADFVVSFMTVLDESRMHLVGHALGGAIAAQIALDHPRRVASLTLLASSGLRDKVNMAYIEAIAHAESRRALKPVLEQMFADTGMVTRRLVDELLSYKQREGATAVLVKLAAELFRGGRQIILPTRALRTERLAVQVLWGKEDCICSVDLVANAPAGSVVHVFKGAGHMLQLERSQAVSRLIVGLL